MDAGYIQHQEERECASGQLTQEEGYALLLASRLTSRGAQTHPVWVDNQPQEAEDNRGL